MQSPKQFDDAIGVFKRYGRRRTRKSHWRKRWITLTNGARLEARAIKQTMRAPKGIGQHHITKGPHGFSDMPSQAYRSVTATRSSSFPIFDFVACE